MTLFLTNSYVNAHTNVHRGKPTARADTFDAHTCNLIHVGATPASPWSMHVCAHTHSRTSHTQNNPSLRKYITIPVQCRLPKTALPRIHGYNSALWQPVDVKCIRRSKKGGSGTLREGTLMLELLPPSNCREIALGHGFFLREKQMTWTKVILHHYWISDQNTNKETIFHPREWEKKSLHLKKTHTRPSGYIYIKAL